MATCSADVAGRGRARRLRQAGASAAVTFSSKSAAVHSAPPRQVKSDQTQLFGPSSHARTHAGSREWRYSGGDDGGGGGGGRPGEMIGAPKNTPPPPLPPPSSGVMRRASSRFPSFTPPLFLFTRAQTHTHTHTSLPSSLPRCEDRLPGTVLFVVVVELLLPSLPLLPPSFSTPGLLRGGYNS